MASPKPSESTIYNITPPREMDEKSSEGNTDYGKSRRPFDTNKMNDVSLSKVSFILSEKKRSNFLYN